MSDFADSSCGGGALDPGKRVNYTRGMVLDEDDLLQEQVYLRARDQLGVRALHGYGTVAGLDVRWDAASGRLQVSSGLAVDQPGRFVCVPTDQCADLAAWVAAHGSELRASIPGQVSVYVVLCHRECETDTVPVPSETCRTADESMAASRIQDSFELRLLLDPPVPAGEAAGGGLARVIDHILSTLESLPDDSVVDADAVRRRLITWVTRERPELATGACLAAPLDNCGERPDAPSTAVLLARIDLDCQEDADGHPVLASPPVVVEEERPVLLSTRFLQEWLTELVLRPDVLGPPPIDDHNALLNLPVGDVHTQYLPADGSRPLEGDLDAGGHALTRLVKSTQPHHAVRADEVFGADLARRPGGAQIDRLQGRRVKAAGPNAPKKDDLLRFDGTAWVPGPPATLRSGPVLPLVTIQLMGRAGVDNPVKAFLLWFHLDVPGNSVLLVSDPGPGGGGPLAYGKQFVIFEELCDGGRPGLGQLAPDLVAVRPLSCNTFRVDIQRIDARLLRFEFILGAMLVGTGQPMAQATPMVEYTKKRRITWCGQDGTDKVTKFVLSPSVDKPTPGFEDVSASPIGPGGPKFTIKGA